MIRRKDVLCYVLEEESGAAVRNSSQLINDREMQTVGAMFVGENAPDRLRGNFEAIRTWVVRVP